MNTTNFSNQTPTIYHNPKKEKPNPTTNEQVSKGASYSKVHAYEVKFLNSLPNPTIIPDKVLPQYYNYFIGNDSSKWRSRCHLYLGVTYKNIYPNIYIRFYSTENSLKYDIIVKPGGDPSKVAMYIDGTDNVRLKNGDLLLNTSVGLVKEKVPFAYQQGEIKKKVSHVHLP